MHRAVASIVTRAQPDSATRTVVLVATRAGAAQLRSTLERLVLNGGSDAPSVLAMPEIATREQWYRQMHARLGSTTPWLNELEREVIFGQAAQHALSVGCAPPFELRSGLVLEILGLYEDLHRNRRSIDAFERLLVGELEPSSDLDCGAERLLRQTRFLVEAFRAYRRQLIDADVFDEERLRERLRTVRTPVFEHAVVTVPDVAADPSFGLWPADFDLLTRLHGLARVDVVATDALLDAGFRDRLDDLLPGAADERWQDVDPDEPVLRQPGSGGDRAFFEARDREEELISFARFVKQHTGTPGGDGPRAVSERTALVFQRPLPYLYLAGPVLDGTGIPYQTVDALPLASESYATAVEAVFACVESSFDTADVLRLLRNPNLRFDVDEVSIRRRDVKALERSLEVGSSGDLTTRLEAICEGGRAAPAGQDDDASAARAALDVVADLGVLARAAPASVLLDGLLAFLEAHAYEPSPDEAHIERHRAVRSSILGALRALRDAHTRFGDTSCALGDIAARVRRWIEAQTFTPRRGADGVHLIDARTARYGDFDDVRLVGLVEGDWPARPRRSIFYPQALLVQLGWSSDTNRFAAGRAEFTDLLRLPRKTVSLSVFTLDEDRLVSPSPLMDSIADARLRVETVDEPASGRISIDDALSRQPVVPDAVAGISREWISLRIGRPDVSAPVFHGRLPPQTFRSHNVTSVEQYIDCPFQYAAQRILQIGTPRDQTVELSSLERGRFVHEIFRVFYAAWESAGHKSITPENIEVARQRFAEVVEERLPSVPGPDRALERGRLLGSALASGAGECVFRIELQRPGRVVERLLEFSLDGAWTFAGDGGSQQLRVRGVADRIDLLADGTLWLFDYKTGLAPSRRRAVQLPVYATCAEQRLRHHRGRDWRVVSAAYVALGERQPHVPLASRPSDLADRLAEGRERFLTAVEGIEAGRFPPAPIDRQLCDRCAYPSVCRKDYVGDV